MTEFVEVKTQDLSGAALDWAVAQIGEVKTVMLSVKSQEAKKPFALFGSLAIAVGGGEEGYSPSSCWHCGGPLILSRGVSLRCIAPLNAWEADCWDDSLVPSRYCQSEAETPLIAACRAIVSSVLGDTVSVPKELV